MANKYWVGASGADWTTASSWSATSGGAGGAAVPTAIDSVFFDQSRTYTVINLAQSNCLNFNVTAGTVTFSMTFQMNIFGNINWAVPVTYNNGSGSVSCVPTSTGTKTILTSGSTITANAITISSATAVTTWQLLDAFTLSGTTSLLLVGGTLQLNGFNINVPTLQVGGTTPIIAFGSNSITCSNLTVSVATLTTTGTPTIYASSTPNNINGGAGPESSACNLSFPFGGSATMSNLSGSFKNVDLTGFSGSVTSFTPNMYGNLILSSSMTVGAGTISFSSTSVDQTITSNSNTINCSLIVAKGATTLRPVDALTLGATKTFTLTSGIFNLNGNVLTTGLFVSNNSNARTIAFGSSNIICNSLGGTVWDTTTITGLTITGTPIVNISNAGSVAVTVASGPITESQAISFNFTAGTYALTFLSVASHSAKNVDFTGFAGTWNARTTANTMYGSLTLSSGMTFAASSGVLTFGATSGTQIITSSAKTIDQPITISGIGGTVQLADALTMGATRALLIQNGTLDGNNKTISGAASFSSTLSGATPFIKNISTALPFTITSGTNVITQSGSNTFGAITFSGGTLSLASYALTCNAFSATSGTRTLAFGTGKIVCVGPPNAGAPGALFTFNSPSGTVTGTGVVDISYSGATAGTVYGGTQSAGETQAISFNITTGTYALTIMPGGSLYKNVNFTGFAGTLVASLTGFSSIYGDLTLSTGMTMPSNANPTLAFQSTSTQTITSNGNI